MILLLVLGFMLVALALLAGLEAALRPRTARRASLRRAAGYSAVRQPRVTPQAPRMSLVEAVVPALSRVALRLTPRARIDELQLRLSAAGLASRLNAQQFLALKTVLGIGGVVLAFASAGVSVRSFLVAVLLFASAMVVPDFAVGRMVRARAERLSDDLPQAIDQIVVSLEAGLGFDAAVSYFVARTKSPLTAELRVMLSEIRMGEPRSEALRRLAARVPSDEVRAFVQTLVQSEGMGISLSGILRSQATDLRHRRQLAAEERAQKAPVKMLFPTVIFILPVMFVIILGPAFQQTKNLFGP